MTKIPPPPTRGRSTANKRTSTPYDLQAAKLLGVLRRKQGLSQSDLARFSGISFQQIQKYESGRNRITVGRLIDLCRIMHIKASDFISKIEDI